MTSVYHLFHDLVDKKKFFLTVKNLEDFPFDEKLLSCRNKGTFPDLAIRLNKDRSKFSGGELIELKDSASYTISSFNSTIPTRKKNLADLIGGEHTSVRKQMEDAGDEVDSMHIRDVFYLVRGRKKKNIKVCLVYGSFFETITVEQLISESFSQVLDERLRESSTEITPAFRQTLLRVFSQQENFSKVRSVEKASVRLRFRIMTEVNAQGNILNASQYPEIKDNTLNFVLPCHDEKQHEAVLSNCEFVFGKAVFAKLKTFKIKHHFNGYFMVIQTSLT
jgi:hypothetical protein